MTTIKERVNRIANGYHDYPTGSAKCYCDGIKGYIDSNCIEKEIKEAIEEEKKILHEAFIKEKQEFIDILELIPLTHKNNCDLLKWLIIHNSCKFSCAALNNKECPIKPECDCHLIKILNKLTQLLTEMCLIKQEIK